MDNIIDALIEIENQAVLITREAEEERKNLPQEIEKEMKKVNERVDRETQEEIKKRFNSVYLECGHKIAEIQRQTENRSKQLHNEYEQKHIQWEEDIFNKILGR